MVVTQEKPSTGGRTSRTARRTAAAVDAAAAEKRPRYTGRSSAANSTIAFEMPMADLTAAVSRAYPFTDSSVSAHFHLQAILIDVGDDDVVFTAESDNRAIEFTVPHTSAVSTGQLLVPGGALSTALGVMDPNGTAYLEYDGKTLFIYSSERRRDEDGVSIKVPRLDSKSLLPEIGDYDPENGVRVDSSTFAERFGIVATSRDTMGSAPILRAVLMEYLDDDEEKPYLSLLASNKRTSTTHQVPVQKVIGDGIENSLLDGDNVLSVIGLLNASDHFDMHLGSTGQIHLVTYDRDTGKEANHVRLSVIRHPLSQYPSAKVRETIQVMIPNIVAYLKVNKGDLLGLMSRAATMCSLDPTASEGQSKSMMVYVEGNNVTVEVRGEAGFSDIVDTLSWDLPGDGVSFKFRYGLFASALQVYPGSGDITMAFFAGKDEGTIRGVLLIETDRINPDEPLPPYTCFFGVAEGRRYAVEDTDEDTDY